jgi:hypothetical protein
VPVHWQALTFRCCGSHSHCHWQTLNVTTKATPPASAYFTLVIDVVSTTVPVPNALSHCYPGDPCPVTVLPSKGANSSDFFIELLDSEDNVTVLALTDRSDALVASFEGGRTVFNWEVPLSTPLGPYRVRASSPAFGLDISTGVSQTFQLAKPFTFVTSDYGPCAMVPGTGLGSCSALASAKGVVYDSDSECLITTVMNVVLFMCPLLKARAFVARACEHGRCTAWTSGTTTPPFATH